ncbi:MAG: hypothetical protein A3B86_04055 [Candidatus Yanofskybacteria bacterium RIFCSPHIGHO2_02_FULL_38_22b]|uniref:Uncharacterized protein n=1 Tax=Candidatus Yanofskybacteria bacterium RIFCSPHIGHO2_02_FULL_38_22b TaxID=1802673 RepID=A0A1F8EZH8_9BACT|nr:MAG: hypothetical protein A2816_01825 [Candidatus Yanofskybacteria bacterium RIFCSPHIGHO2_01_FULL_39_44]OGN06265.1 MAG: hypothetical protein A3B86_04055 [Candidatus Yanofskybacteria bacterium RIFCSPHIGHO2_02_FULL_38_22b]OGN19685.1 MAG: hypothetical protein A2910_03790 [Candidatus Yanofskybacteria bacterium RIFCSPLOWO2_01_FULL_39_28]
MKMSAFITIPKEITGNEELVILPRRDLDKILKEKSLTEDDVLRWSKEVKKLKKQGKLPILESLASLR